MTKYHDKIIVVKREYCSAIPEQLSKCKIFDFTSDLKYEENFLWFDNQQPGLIPSLLNINVNNDKGYLSIIQQLKSLEKIQVNQSGMLFEI